MTVPALSHLPRLYCDEDVDGRLAEALRQRGFDVETTAAAGQINTTDDEQILYAIRQRRALITHNIRHFPVLHARWLAAGEEHWGILILTGQAAIGPWLHQIEDVIHRFTDDALRDQLLFISPAHR